MLKEFEGWVVEESLEDSRLLNTLELIGFRISKEDNPADRWHLYKVKVSEEDIEAIQKGLKPKWYAHFWTGRKVIAVFKEKKLEFAQEDRKGMEEAVNYGLSQGIPEEQLDFPTEPLEKTVNARVAAKAFIVDDEERLLILKREPENVQMPEAWELGGGRLEPGENPFEGLKREVMEETGLEIEVQRPLSVRHFTRKDGQVITMLVFVCKPLGKEVKLSKEHTEFEWIPVKEARGKITEFFNAEIDEYLRKDFKT